MTFDPLRSRFAPACLLALMTIVAGCATSVPPQAADADAPVVALNAAAPAASAVAASAPAPAASAAATDGPAAPSPADKPVAVDPLRSNERVDLDARDAQADLWTRVRRGFAIPDMDGSLVREQEQWYATRPDYVQRMTERGSRYLFHIVEEVERRGMPTELALLPFIESAFNPQAISSAKASGMWQFIPSTGRFFDLKQNLFRDDRRDVLASTRAALDYLGKLHGMFGDWQLALAAYNWGEGSVQRAIARNQKAGLPTDYVSLRMPSETRSYYPKLQAVKNIVTQPANFSLTLPPLENHPYFLGVPITRDIDVDIAARLAGMETSDFQKLNPQMNKPVILAAGTPQVLLPYDNANRFVRELSGHGGALATWTAWVTPKTARPGEIAKQVGMSEPELREINHIPPFMRVKAGSTLLVRRSESRHTDVAEHIADNAMMTLSPDRPEGRRTVLKAGKHDSVASIATRYRLSASQVAQWNKVSAGASFKAGQSVLVYLSAPPARAAGSRRAAAKPALRQATQKAAPSRLVKTERPRAAPG